MPALLLSELQRLAGELQAERAQRIELAATLAELAAEVARLKGRGAAAEHHGESR